MSSLSQTILGGTSQIGGAYQSALEQRNKNALIKRNAIQQLNDSIGDMGKAWKEHRDWKAAKQAEDEERQVYDADVLARSQGAVEHVPAALGALRLRTPGAAKIRAQLASRAQDDHLATLKHRLDAAKVDQEAGVARVKAQESESQREAMRAAVEKYGAEIDNPIVAQNALSGNLTMDQLLRYVTQQRLEKKAEADRVAKSETETARETGRNKRQEATLAYNRERDTAVQAGRAEDREIRRTHLDWQMDADEADRALSTWAKTIDASIRTRMATTAMTRADIDAAETMLKSEQSAFTEDKKILANYRTQKTDDPAAISRLETSITGHERSISGLLRDLNILRGKLKEEMPAIPPAPDGAPRAGAATVDPDAKAKFDALTKEQKEAFLGRASPEQRAKVGQ